MNIKKKNCLLLTLPLFHLVWLGLHLPHYTWGTRWGSFLTLKSDFYRVWYNRLNQQEMQNKTHEACGATVYSGCANSMAVILKKVFSQWNYFGVGISGEWHQEYYFAFSERSTRKHLYTVWRHINSAAERSTGSALLCSPHRWYTSSWCLYIVSRKLQPKHVGTFCCARAGRVILFLLLYVVIVNI